MTRPGRPDLDLDPDDASRLPDLTEDITRRLLSGEPFDAEAFIALHPDCAQPIRDLLPAMHSLIEFGKSLAPPTSPTATTPKDPRDP
jgi:hypothetical protein